jgi:hypothetical protein
MIISRLHSCVATRTSASSSFWRCGYRFHHPLLAYSARPAGERRASSDGPTDESGGFAVARIFEELDERALVLERDMVAYIPVDPQIGLVPATIAPAQPFQSHRRIARHGHEIASRVRGRRDRKLDDRVRPDLGSRARARDSVIVSGVVSDAFLAESKPIVVRFLGDADVRADGCDEVSLSKEVLDLSLQLWRQLCRLSGAALWPLWGSWLSDACFDWHVGRP